MEDEQPNSVAGFDDISLVLLEEHLKATGSKLAKQVSKRGVKDILEEMKLLTGEPERLRTDIWQKRCHRRTGSLSGRCLQIYR
ncbi:hypothetical protein [Anaerobutyricum hallii]|uniref:Uncharacterized protein n=1 Tax=Anaerobutyricum hallii TaxID=39488 RepID=A0A415U5P8_9FIRM|nr:hypothetical protein [Anaerobutyricum hallii]RHN13341.1 hypothetical protein DWZ29_07735 [Anaerobutyricum hallii]